MRFSTAASGTSLTRTHIFIRLPLLGNWYPPTQCYPIRRLTDESIGNLVLTHRAADEVYDRLCGRAGRKDLRHAQLLELGDVLGGDRPADSHEHIVDALLAQQSDDPRHEGHMRAREDRQNDGGGVLLG